jgi:hypothetical protein
MSTKIGGSELLYPDPFAFGWTCLWFFLTMFQTFHGLQDFIRPEDTIAGISGGLFQNSWLFQLRDYENSLLMRT